MLEFQMFRIKVYPSPQGFLFEPPKTPSEILKDVILSLPSAELRKGMIWHIGNLSPIKEGGLYFRIGRTTKSTLEIYENGNFELAIKLFREKDPESRRDLEQATEAGEKMTKVLNNVLKVMERRIGEMRK